MKLSTLYAKTKKAVEEYHMIEQGDCIAVGLSGGKDSLTLLYALHGLSKYKDADFTLHAVMVDMGFGGLDTSAIEKFCKDLDIDFTVITTRLNQVIFEERNEKNPCSICSKMRKGIINKTIKSLGCNKLAYGHHRDDFINTMLLSMFREGRFHTMQPKMHMSDSNIDMIRPLLYVKEEEIKIFAEQFQLPISKNPCPVDGNTDRTLMSELVVTLKKTFPDCEEKFFHAIQRQLLK